MVGKPIRTSRGPTCLYGLSIRATNEDVVESLPARLRVPFRDFQQPVDKLPRQCRDFIRQLLEVWFSRNVEEDTSVAVSPLLTERKPLLVEIATDGWLVLELSKQWHEIVNGDTCSGIT